LIGHAGHPEVIGTMGQYENSEGGMYLVETPEDVAKLKVKNPDDLCFVTQTTLSVDETSDVIDALRAHFPKIQGPRKDDICYATQNRQDAVREMAGLVDAMLVVGSRNSSNSNRLRELAEKVGAKAYLIDDASMIEPQWLDGVVRIGVTAGASAPDVLVQNVIARLRELGGKIVTEHPGREENVVFEVPPELRIL
ncbi:MAG: 4-hydroxy-3-methylbut-2-enyl diphosphate reductase, partial [Aeromonas sp.]|nr:4-hydroxy-3-methylbut-2-enyl diphosphate reductase [Aeromonas sp.]